MTYIKYEDMSEEPEIQMPVVSANPGFYILTYHKETDHVFKEPVLAWALDQYFTCPITFRGIEKSDDYLMHPNGDVSKMTYEREYYGTYDDWLKKMRENK